MARRKKTGLFDDVTSLVALLPWWAGVALALLSYLLLHGAASQPVLLTAQPGHMGAAAAKTFWKTLASVFQYLLPLMCLVGAGISAWRRRVRRKLVADSTQHGAGDALDGMAWREFEVLVGEGFRLQGYKVVQL